MTYKEIHKLVWQRVVDVLDSDKREDWKDRYGCFDVELVKVKAVDKLYQIGLMTGEQHKMLYAYSCCAVCVAYKNHCAGCPLKRCTCVDDCLYNDVYVNWDKKAAVKIRDVAFPGEAQS